MQKTMSDPKKPRDYPTWPRRAPLAPPGEAPRKKYERVKDALLRGIHDGTYPPGTCLPSENELMRRFEVSRITVRQALERLHAAELIESHRGKGHIVQPLRAVQDLGRLQGFGEIMAPVGVAARSEVLGVARVPALGEVASKLQLGEGEEVVRIERLRIAAYATVSYDISYFPLDVGERLVEHDLAGVDIFSLLEDELGIELAFADITMEMTRPDPGVAKHLSLPDGAPAIRIERLSYSASDWRPIDFEYLYGAPQYHQFKLRVPRW